MDDQLASKMIDEMKQQNQLQEETNNLMRSLISAMESTAQELLDLREQMEKGSKDTVSQGFSDV